MTTNTARLLRVLFFVYAAFTFLHIAYVVLHEPFAFDSWNFARDTDAKPFTVARLFQFWGHEYAHSNPRFGQPFAYLAYKLGGVAEVGTPLAYLGIVYGGFVLAVGRWPDLKRGADLAVLSIGIGFFWFASPNFPAYMFCRAYATNYLWMATLQVWLLVAMRLHDPTSSTSVLRIAGVTIFGVMIGMSNEHTGPTFVLITVGYAAWSWRTRKAPSWFLNAAAIGVMIGFLLIFFAPGQSERYDEFLKEKFTVTQQILVRGIGGNLEILKGWFFAAAPLLALLIAMIAVGTATDRRKGDELEAARREQRRGMVMLVLAIAAGLLITCTVFASPKLGPRFYLHAMVLLLAGTMGIAHAYLSRTRAFVGFVLLAVVSSGYAAARTIPLFTRISRDAEVRIAQLESTQPRSVYTATAWESVSESWWFLGDDFRDQKKREFVAKYFALRRVLFTGADVWTTLGIDNVKLTMHYEFDKREVCLDEVDAIDIKPYVGRDIAAIVHTFTDSIAEIQEANPAQLEYLDLVATFKSDPAPMPASKLFVARWTNGVLEAYVAKVARKGHSTVRVVQLPATLKTSPWDIYAVAVGDPPRKLGVSTDAKELTYQPWTSKMYWFLACKPDACFVIQTANHKI